MTGFLFEVSFWAAAPVWLLMIFAPGWDPTVRIARSPLTAVPVLLVYLALAVPVLPPSGLRSAARTWTPSAS